MNPSARPETFAHAAKARLERPKPIATHGDKLLRVILLTLDSDDELRARYLRRRWHGVHDPRHA